MVNLKTALAGPQDVARRRFLLGTAALAPVVIGALSACSSTGTASTNSNGPIVVASIMDETGDLNIYGKGKANATQLAIEQINAAGGLLGRQVQLKTYDAQSDLNKYAQYANQAALQDKPAVVQGAITSAAREAMRPVLGRSKTLYFYGNIYEGGVCDSNMFVTGIVPSQQVQALLPYAMKNLGKRVYIVAADYNFGQTEAVWIKQYVENAGGTVVGTDFIPTSSSDFGSIISKIQKEKPDFIASVLVGSNHLAFYRSFTATGLKSSIPIISTSFGGQDIQLLTSAESSGITVAYPYFQELKTPANETFVAAWKKKFGNDSTISDVEVSAYNGWMLWAEAVKKAGSTDRDAVIKALESGVFFDGPAGKITMNGKSHQVTLPVSIAKVNDDAGYTIVQTQDAVEPAFEQQKCNLIDNPSQNEVFVPNADDIAQIAK